ncbi:MAG: sigma-70 family RNA polymerase sigma factor [Lysobacterales bacterium]
MLLSATQVIRSEAMTAGTTADLSAARANSLAGWLDGPRSGPDSACILPPTESKASASPLISKDPAMDYRDPETTIELLQKSHDGDQAARDRLLARYLPILSRWAHGRLPQQARDLSETADLVQLTLIRALNNLPTFVSQGPGAFFGYLRQVMNNLVRDELRRVGRKPLQVEMDEQWPEDQPTPGANMVTLQALKNYEKGLSELDPEQRELVVMRVELGMGHEEIARIINSPSSNAARMKVARALATLAKHMAATPASGRA